VMEALAERCVVPLVIEAGEALRPQLLSRINDACNRVEDARSGAGLLLLRLCESRERSAGPQWPGAVTVHEIGKWEQALRRIERLDALTMALVEGRCYGAAIEALVVADCRFATAGATLQLRAGDGAVWPGMILHRLTCQLGVASARRLLIRGEIAGADAAAIGLIDAVVAGVEAALTTMDFAAHPHFGMHRRLLLDGAGASYDEMLGCHLAACDRQLRCADASA
jgi:isomerase DpgB